MLLQRDVSMRAIFGKLLMFLGAAMIMAALALFLYNQKEQTQAADAAMSVMPELVDAINDHVKEAAQQSVQETLAVAVEEAPIKEMTETLINGYYYIGFVGIPELELELPIMTDWDYKKLNIAPCRYTGNLYSDDLVLMAHNYYNHFGRLSSLSLGDTVTFTDMDGNTVFYQVVAMDVLDPNATEEMTAGEYDLTLFTCTYGGASRVTVRCDRTEE